MWLENLKNLKKKTGMTSKQIAERSGLSERTVARVFSGEKDSHYADTLSRIATALGSTLDEVLGDTKAVVGTQELVVLTDAVDTATAEIEMLKAEVRVLQDKVASLMAENDLLRLKLEHKEEIIAIHNYYIKRGAL